MPFTTLFSNSAIYFMALSSSFLCFFDISSEMTPELCVWNVSEIFCVYGFGRFEFSFKDNAVSAVDINVYPASVAA